MKAEAQVNPMKDLYGRLATMGVPKAFVRSTLLPSWWNDAVATSPAGYAEALGYLSKRLGVSIDLLRGGTAQRASAPPPSRVKFKLAKGADHRDIVLARNLAAQVAKHVAHATTVPFLGLPSAQKMRAAMLKAGAPWVSFESLVDHLWAAGVPVVYVNQFPPGTKKMHGLAANVDGRPVIVVSKNHRQGAWLLFIVGHETGHIALEHVPEGEVFVDETVGEDHATVVDSEEQAANEYAVELLCGDVRRFEAERFLPSAPALAQKARSLGVKHKIDPGHVVLNYAKSMSDARGGTFFPVAQAAIKILDPKGDAVALLRSRMAANLDLSRLSEESAEFVRRMTGLSEA